MSEVQSWLNTLGALGGPALILWQLIKTRKIASQAALNSRVAVETVTGMASNVAELTVNTNSIKDALVETTKLEAYARGVKDEKESA